MARMEKSRQEAQEAMDGSPVLVEVFTSTTLEPQGEIGEMPRQEPLIRIKFQCGPIGEVGINGCGIEDVIDVLIRRLDGFQRGPFACPENGGAIAYLEGAKRLLLERRVARRAQGVEGTQARHVSER